VASISRHSGTLCEVCRTQAGGALRTVVLATTMTAGFSVGRISQSLRHTLQSVVRRIKVLTGRDIVRPKAPG
jgi:hypothetical protein